VSGPNALDELAGVAANALVLAFGQEALRTGQHDYLGLTSAVARLALTRALEAQVPGFPGLWLDRPAVDGPLPVAPPAPLGGGDDVDAFIAAVLRGPKAGGAGAPGA